ncbi:hypothetical protein AVJ23_07140 [Pseudoponticoccus marisrubri]|uniref:Uncharacterized protein n=1 Tax=Pseudoponticoccus marisrubri TaxID=1685382 RepID=A0A0W7WM05_9RHOB|nr:hypothetical protein AVJ23_07140 [Pseudoponticoccus marisrubri]
MNDPGGGVQRYRTRFVPVTSAERQAALLDHKARDFLIRQRTQIVDTIRAHSGEFGVVVAKGIHNFDRRLEAACDMPDAARPALEMLSDQLRDTQALIEEVTARTGEMQSEDALARRLATEPEVGTISSGAFAVTPPMWPLSAARVTTRHGSYRRRQPIPVAEKRGSGGSPRRAIDLCEGCSASAQWPGSARGGDVEMLHQARRWTDSTRCLSASP